MRNEKLKIEGTVLDLVELIESALEGELDQASIEWDQRSSMGVVMAAGGYPESYEKGDVIRGIPTETTNSKVFHAGTSSINGDIVTSGGRVLCVVGLGDKVSDAQKTAYEIVHQIEWDNVFYRDDIGYRAIAREKQ